MQMTYDPPAPLLSIAAARALFASTVARWTRYSADAYVSPISPEPSDRATVSAARVAASSETTSPTRTCSAAVAHTGVPVTPPIAIRAAVQLPPSTETTAAAPATA